MDPEMPALADTDGAVGGMRDTDQRWRCLKCGETIHALEDQGCYCGQECCGRSDREVMQTVSDFDDSAFSDGVFRGRILEDNVKMMRIWATDWRQDR